MSNIILQVIAIIKPSTGPEEVTSRLDKKVKVKNFKNKENLEQVNQGQVKNKIVTNKDRGTHQDQSCGQEQKSQASSTRNKIRTDRK